MIKIRRTIKRIGVFLTAIVLMLSFTTNASAYTGGLLDGNALNHGTNATDSGTPTNALTDGDLSTSVLLEPFTGDNSTKDSIWYDFSTTKTIDSYQINADSTSMELQFRDSSGNTLKTIDGASLVVDGTKQSITEVSGVKKVLIRGSINSTTVYEADVFEANADITAPGEVTNLTETHDRTSATLSYTLPTDSDFSHVNVYLDGLQIDSGVTTTSYNIGSLTESTTYTATLKTVDDNGNESTGKSITFTTSSSTSYESITNLQGDVSGNTITLTWDGGTSPFTVSQDGTEIATVTDSVYRVDSLELNTTYAFEVTDGTSTDTATLTTDSEYKVTAPLMPKSTDTFQKMVDVFGKAGTYALIVIAGGVSLGLITILAMYIWRLLKKWLSSAK